MATVKAIKQNILKRIESSLINPDITYIILLISARFSIILVLTVHALVIILVS